MWMGKNTHMELREGKNAADASPWSGPGSGWENPFKKTSAKQQTAKEHLGQGYSIGLELWGK